MIGQEELRISTNDVNVWCSLAVMLFLISLVLLFGIKWRHDSIPIMQVLTILLANQILYSASEMLGYINQQDHLLCTISIIGRMAFSVAANFWIIFITRLIYRQALAPGKYFNLLSFVLRNIILTYIPSLILSIFLLLIIAINNTESEQKCWQILTNTQFLDYIIYITTFILPNLLTSIIIMVYLVKICRLENKKWTIFLLYSLVDLGFSLYYVGVRVGQFVGDGADGDGDAGGMGYWDLVMIGQPVIFGVLYILVYLRQRNKQVNSSDITIRGSEGQASFIDDL